VSERVTWEPCLRCGDVAAVGWASAVGTDGARAPYRPIEFDCVAGCSAGIDELLAVYGVRRSPGSST
jgi:hypothetical protein